MAKRKKCHRRRQPVNGNGKLRKKFENRRKGSLRLPRQKIKPYEIELAPGLKIGTGLLNDPVALTEALKIINARSKYNVSIDDGKFIVREKMALAN